MRGGARSLDFFSVDFNEDITAFHGQTLLDQAEYLNEAIRYILSLYLDPRMSARDPDLPDPTSVIIVGHSMGGIVARTMLVMPNYQSNSINTIVTMSAPHARPPVTFDGDIVQIYNDINDYWRKAYSQQWANNNPLWHVTLVSIAGGGLDTVVPSDYASLESIVPDTHGFTVFTSTIPNVWTSMDHQAILWCDQFRKVIAPALYDVIDVTRATQTKPRAERMRVFKKWFLTGMESVAEKTVPAKEPSTLLTLEDNSNAIISQGERLVLRKLGSTGRPQAHLLPVPPPGSPQSKRFTLLTDQKLDGPGEVGKLEVLFCSVFPLQPGQAGMFPVKMDLSGDSTGSTRLSCTNAASDVVALPASNRDTHQPFYLDGEKEITPFSYLQFNLGDILEYQFVAVIDKASSPSPGFAIAEFSDHSQSHRTRHISLQRLLAFGMRLRLPATRPMVTEIKIPSLQSSLLAYKLEIGNQACGDGRELFAPLVRQYLSEPFESKYFVNARQVSVSLHGVAPYLPPPLKKKSPEDGLSFQLWTDPTCDSNIHIRLEVDVLGSMGKLYMRYRTVLAAFPLLIIALVLRKQFRIYDKSGVFISFTESLDMCLRRSIPLMLASLTLLSLSMGTSRSQSSAGSWHSRNGTHGAVNFHQNDLLVGTQDPFFWFLIPPHRSHLHLRMHGSTLRHAGSHICLRSGIQFCELTAGMGTQRRSAPSSFAGVHGIVTTQADDHNSRTAVFGLDAHPLPVRLPRRLSRSAGDDSQGPSHRFRDALQRKLRLLQLCTLDPYAASLGSANQSSHPCRLDPKPDHPLAHPLFIASQRPVHHAFYRPGRGFDDRQDDTSGHEPTNARHESVAFRRRDLRRRVRRLARIRAAPSRQPCRGMARCDPLHCRSVVVPWTKQSVLGWHRSKIGDMAITDRDLPLQRRTTHRSIQYGECQFLRVHNNSAGSSSWYCLAVDWSLTENTITHDESRASNTTLQSLNPRVNNSISHDRPRPCTYKPPYFP